MKKTLEEISLSKGEYGGGFSAVDNFDNAPRYIRITDITDEGKLNEEVKAPSGNLKEWGKYELHEGDLLFARSGATVGKTFLYNKGYGNCIFAGYLIRFKLNTKITIPKYVYYYTKTPEYYNWIEKKQNVVAQPNINAKQYGSELEIPLPPLPTQQKIAAILDAADAYRQKTKTLIGKYDQLAQSLFLEMFGDPVRNEKEWEKRILGSLTHMITDGKHGNCNDEVNSEYFFISAKDVNNGSIVYSQARQIPKNEFEETDSRTNLQAGDLVMVNTGATIGKMAIAKNIPETRRTTFQKSVAVIKTKKDLISNVFLQYVFLLKINTFANKGSGSAIQNLLLSEMRRFDIILPPITLQTQFAECVQLIESQKQQAQASLQKAEDLFNSLLQRAFKGELTGV